MNIHLITNCTSRKRHSSNDKKYCFSDFINKNRIEEDWINTMQSQNRKTKAINKYMGEHWSIVKELSKTCSQVSIVSAGYGLISSETLIHSYDATFSANKVNSVGQIYNTSCLYSNNLRWWRKISQPHNSCSSTLENLYLNKNQFFIISLSPVYLKVLEPEILELKKKNIINNNNTRIISSNVKIDNSIKSIYLKSSEDFCKILGGSRISLNIRLAKSLLQNIDSNYDLTNQIDENFKNIINLSIPAKKYKRKKLQDDELKELICNEISELNGKKVTSSGVLRRLRDKGYACEQKRFSTHFKNVNFNRR